MFALADLLTAADIPQQPPKVLTGARVPIVKYRDAKSRIDVDVAFGVSTGLENATVVQELLQKNVYIRPLSLILKHYLKQKGLNECYNGGLSSYALVLMIAGYLMISFKFAKATLSPPVSQSVALATHLVGFAEFYSRQFQFPHHVLSLREGGQLLPKMAKNWFNPQNPYLLSIEDPHNIANDVGVSAYRIDRITIAFEELYSKLVARLIPSSHTLALPSAAPSLAAAAPSSVHSPPPQYSPTLPARPSAKFKTVLSEVIFVPTFIMDSRSHVANVYQSMTSADEDTESPSGSDKELGLPVNSSGDSEDDITWSDDEQQNRWPRQVHSAPVERKSYSKPPSRSSTPDLTKKEKMSDCSNAKTIVAVVPGQNNSNNKKAVAKHARANSNASHHESALQSASLNPLSSNSHPFPENPQRKNKEVLV
jgi:DNA polymerase sigma